MTRRRWLALGIAAAALVAFAVWAAGRIAGLSEDTQATNPLFRWEYLFVRERTPEELWQATREHLELTVVPVLLGLVLSAGLSALILRFAWLRAVIFTFAGVLYTIPSLALFAILVTYNSNWTAAVIALTSYTLLILTRNIVAGIDAVPAAALDAADGLGMSRLQRLRRVEIPLAMPVILTGIRVATVTIVGLVGISAVIQLGGLATYIFDGFNRDYTTLMVLGTVATIVLAVALDLAIRGIERAATPWNRRGRGPVSALLLAAQVAEPTNVWEWLGDSSQRPVTGDIPSQVWTTLWHSLLAFALAAGLAIPAAAVLAHFRRAEVLLSWLVNIGRVIPTVTIVAVLVIISLRNGYGFEPWPIVIALVLLALPPLYANTYTAVRDASPEAVGAARAMGLTELQILRRVELPLATPLILAACRVALTQVVATEALAALFGGTGLGQYITFGLANRDIYEVQAGAVLVAGLAMTVDVTFWLVTRFLVPRPLRPAPSSRRAMRPTRSVEPPIQPTPIGGTP